jgi:hypothetical protein
MKSRYFCGRVFLTALAVHLAAASLCAQSIAPLDKLVGQVKAQTGNTRLALIKAPVTYAEYLASHAVQQQVSSSIEQQRVDKQVGGTSSSGSGTSATSTGSVPWLFGFAVEHGALTQSVENNTLVFRGNVANMIKAVKVKDYIESYRLGQDNMFVRNLSKVSFSVSFNASQNGTGISQTSTSTSTASGANNKNTLAGYSFHFDIYNRRDPRDRKWDGDWNGLLSPRLQEVVNGWGTFSDLIDKHPAEKGLWDSYIQQQLTQFQIDTTDEQSIRDFMTKVSGHFVEIFGEIPEIKNQAAAIGKLLLTYGQQKGKVLQKINQSPIFSFEYNNVRQSAQQLATGSQNITTSSAVPDLSNLNLIAGFYFMAKSQLTLNASTTLFNSRPTGSKSGLIRDYRFSSQVDIPLPEIVQLGSPTLTFSGLFLSLLAEPLGQQVLVNGVAVTRTGNIGLMQAKISVPVKNSGVKVPISLTVSNRTELVKEKDVRGSIGVTLDLDSIFSKP